jgi:hypothetical protein
MRRIGLCLLAAIIGAAALNAATPSDETTAHGALRAVVFSDVTRAGGAA